MRVVLDTNVAISGLLADQGPPARIVDLWMSGQFEVAVSPPIIAEHLGVFLRPTFAAIGPPDARQAIIEDLVSLPSTVFVVPEYGTTVAPSCVQDDPSDGMFLDCAIAGQCDFLVSGDRHLLALGEYEGIPAISPAHLLGHIR